MCVSGIKPIAHPTGYTFKHFTIDISVIYPKHIAEPYEKSKHTHIAHP